MRNIANSLTAATLAAGLALGYGGSAAAAAPAPAPAATPAPQADQAQVEGAMLYLRVLISALQSDKVEQPVKGALVGCLYNNSLSTISGSMDKVIAQNPDKIHRDNPSELLSAMAQICGYTPAAAAGSEKAPKGR